MKFYKFLLACLILTIHFKANACDVCGCSMGGTYFGILPQFHKHFIGLQYSYRSFDSEHLVLGSDTKSISQETFRSLELRGRLNLSKKIQIFLFAPYHINQQIEENSKVKISGIGDITAIANYSLYNNGDSLNQKWKHNLQFGGGIKLPTGKFNTLDYNEEINPNIQSGTGSYDFLIDAIYTVRYKKLGLNNTLIYRINNRNENKFQFGNRLTFATSLFYWANIKGYSLLPSIGLNFDNAQTDVHNLAVLSQSGGNTLATTIGLDFYYHNFTIGTNVHIPAYQDNDVTTSNLKISMTLLYNF